MQRSLAKGRQAEIPTTRDDPAIGRWGSVDPLMHLYPSVSPYVYSLNDPIGKRDPDGRLVIGGQFGIEVGAGLGFSFNLAVTNDTRGGNWDLLGSVGRGVFVGKSLNANVGLIVGERYTRTSDLIGESVEYGVDVSVAVKGGGYAYSESKDNKVRRLVEERIFFHGPLELALRLV